ARGDRGGAPRGAARRRARPRRLARRRATARGRGRRDPLRRRRRAREPRLRARRPRSPPFGRPRDLRGRGAGVRRRARSGMARLRELVRNERGVPPLGAGHSLCQGCGIPLVVRTVLDSIRTPVVVVNATGCLEVATTRYPTTAWNVPWLHVAFEN